MRAMFRSAILTTSLFAIALFPCLLYAQEASGLSFTTTLKLKPIEIEYHTLGGLQYSVEGRSLENYREFEELVLPLRDFELERLLRRSESSNLNSQIFGTAGLAAFLAGLVGLLTAPSNQQTPFWAVAISGGVLVDIGGLFQSEAQTTKFNCAQRYNRFARGEEQVLPQVPKDESGLLNFGSKEGAGAAKNQK